MRTSSAVVWSLSNYMTIMYVPLHTFLFSPDVLVGAWPYVSGKNYAEAVSAIPSVAQTVPFD